MGLDLGDERKRLTEEASRLRAMGVLGRSGMIIRLFDFLLACTLEGRSPKEIEIAQEVFDKTAAFEVVQDASVRVYVHRLRRKLAAAYADAAPGTDRMIIPRGDYRLALAPEGAAWLGGELDEEGAVDDGASGQLLADPVPPSAGRRAHSLAPGSMAKWGAWLLVVLLILVNVGQWVVHNRRRESDPFPAVVHTPLWQPVQAKDLPTFVVLGDNYAFEDVRPDQDPRLIIDPAINSKDDLDNYLLTHGREKGQMIDLDRHYLPLSVSVALRSVLPVADGAAIAHHGRPRMLATSQVTPDLLKTGHIVYIGFFDQLGVLRDPLFSASSFAAKASYDDLVDKVTGRHFVTDARAAADGQSLTRAYGYLASLPGPAGNRIIVIAGTRDAAVMQMGEVAADPQQINLIASRVGGAAAFEALYEVHTIGNVNIGSQLVVARAMHDGSLWRSEPKALSSASATGGAAADTTSNGAAVAR